MLPEFLNMSSVYAPRGSIWEESFLGAQRAGTKDGTRGLKDYRRWYIGEGIR